MSLRERLLAGGLVDMHFHIGPELIPRRYDVETLAREVAACGITVVLKNHTYSTTPLASLARAHHGARILGGVVLNRFVGGLNPDAVVGAASGNHARVEDPSLQEPPFIVWMPTVHAASHLRALGQAFDDRWWGSCGAHEHPSSAGPAVEVSGNEKLGSLLDQVASCGALLATGHLHADEIMQLVPQAVARGITVVITHPHYPSVDLADAQLVELIAHPNVFIEHCFAIHTIEQVPLERFATSLAATGVDRVVLSSDFGQLMSLPTPEGSLRFAEMMAAWVSEDDLVRMLTVNPRRALRLA